MRIWTIIAAVVDPATAAAVGAVTVKVVVAAVPKAAAAVADEMVQK